VAADIASACSNRNHLNIAPGTPGFYAYFALIGFSVSTRVADV
jgi:hypothetical protein